jgi:translation elongation factor EF-1alpha
MFLKWLFGDKQSKPVGKVVHYFDKIQVMVVQLTGAIKVGDKIKVQRGDETFTEAILSMQIDHSAVSSGRTGDEVAIKVSHFAKAGALVYRV